MVLAGRTKMLQYTREGRCIHRIVRAKASEKPTMKQKGLASIQTLVSKSRVRRSRVQNGTELHRSKGVLNIGYWEYPYSGSVYVGYGPFNGHTRHGRRHGKHISLAGAISKRDTYIGDTYSATLTGSKLPSARRIQMHILIQMGSRVLFPLLPITLTYN